MADTAWTKAWTARTRWVGNNVQNQRISPRRRKAEGYVGIDKSTVRQLVADFPCDQMVGAAGLAGYANGAHFYPGGVI